MSKKVIIIGAGGHAKVLADIVIKSGDTLLGFLDDVSQKDMIGYPILGKISDSYRYSHRAVFVMGLGDNALRKEIANKYELPWYTAIHPSACVGIDVVIGVGTVVMANTAINTSVVIGKHCIINTGTVIEHDNILHDYVHISPGSSIGGTVSIGELTWIGIGTSVVNNVSISNNCIIGAGSVVISNITNPGTYVGVPVKKVK